MKPERWQRIEELYHAALERMPNYGSSMQLLSLPDSR